MTYEQKLKWREMEILLPILVESLEKRKRENLLSMKIEMNENEKVELIEIRKELEVEEEYFKKMAEVVKGIKMSKRQITPKEAEGLLYLLWLTGLSVTDFFDEYEYIPAEIYSKVRKKYDGVAFNDADFLEVFKIYGIITIRI